MTEEIDLCLLNEGDLDQIVLSFKNIGWNKPRSLYESYLKEQTENLRTVLVAKKKSDFCGYVTIKWKSDYPSFKQQNIPEISDLNVLPNYRKQGIGTLLITTCEASVKERQYTNIGIGFGLTADYGNAQRLYVQLGYLPDGHGLFYNNKSVPYGSSIVADDDLVIYLCKSM